MKCMDHQMDMVDQVGQVDPVGQGHLFGLEVPMDQEGLMV